MKKISLITLISMALISCQTITEKEVNQAKHPIIIGYEFDDEGQKLDIVAGDVGVTSIWLDYIEAHNNRNLDKIYEIDAKEIEVYRQDGTVGKGRDTHKKVLGDWFKSSNPNWKVIWMVTNTVEHKGGKTQNWLTTGNEFTDVVDGKETMIHSIADVNFVDGKIKRINIYNRLKEQK